MKPFASISMDLDNQWSYMKTHGDAGWEKYPSYLDVLVPYVLDVLDRWNLKITFFIVGQDAAMEKNKEMLKLIVKKGHEVGNHSFHHEPWLHLYAKDRLKREVLKSEKCIIDATGQKPVGFRGPGFSWSPDLIEILVENDYLYDASTLPTYIGPLARMYYFWTSNLNEEEKDQRKELFGSIRDGLRPVNAHIWQKTPRAKLLEIPVTTIPIIKTPFHLSYLLYLSRFSQDLMFCYLLIAIGLCKLTRTEPSFLLHPLDLLGSEQVPELAFFPGMDLSKEHKLAVFNSVIETMSTHFRLVNMSTHAKSLLSDNTLKVIQR